MIKSSEFDDRIIGHLSWLRDKGSVGTRTWKLADRHSCTVTFMRRQMLRLEKAGIVRRHERYTACNDIFWELAD